MRKALAATLVFFMLNLVVLDTAMTATPSLALPLPPDEYQYQPYSPEQLENLLAPIALYPDPLLAQVLPASTFVDQVQQAADWVQRQGPNGIDDQDWDVSVKAVSHYPMVIQMMAQRIDWTTSLGQAYVNQSTDVMSAIQRLRRMARSQGNLYSTPQQRVLYEGGYVQIVPAQPRYIYVPTYDPAVVYVRPHRDAVVAGVAIGFTAGLLIGAWLNRDCDWREHRVYYAGWQGHHGWRGRSRQYVHVDNITYVNNTYTVVNVNKTVVNRPVNVIAINNYNSVHRNIMYKNVEHNNTVVRRNPNLDRPTVGERNRRLQEQNPSVGKPVATGTSRDFPNQPTRHLPPARVAPPVSQPAHQQADHRPSQPVYGTATPPVNDPAPSARQEARAVPSSRPGPPQKKQEMSHQQASLPPLAPVKAQPNRVERHAQKPEKSQKQETHDRKDR